MAAGVRKMKIGGSWKSYAVLAGAALLFAFPGYWLTSSAVKTQDRIFANPPEVLPWPVAWSNFADVYAETRIVRAFFNTVLIAGCQVALTLLVCSMAGLAFARYRDAPGHKWLFALTLGTMMIPVAVTTIPVFIMLSQFGLINTYWGMILPGAANAFGVFWMRQYISQNVPRALYDAAEIDGAGHLTTYWCVVLPVIRPAMAALGVLVLINSWNNLMWAFIVLRTPDMQTMPLLIYMLQGEQGTPYGQVMAAGLLAAAPLVCAFLLFQRAFIGGVTAGAVKG
ncbi:MAG: carbohydrate ABC transporter permease [Planctomycetota bacterium]